MYMYMYIYVQLENFVLAIKTTYTCTCSSNFVIHWVMCATEVLLNFNPENLSERSLSIHYSISTCIIIHHNRLTVILVGSIAFHSSTNSNDSIIPLFTSASPPTGGDNKSRESHMTGEGVAVNSLASYVAKW